MSSKKKLPLRIGVGIVLLNNQNNIFVGKRIDNPKNFWQMPQGGVNNNENYFKAAKRELNEETSVKSIKLVKEIDGWFEYELPKNLLGKVWKGKYTHLSLQIASGGWPTQIFSETIVWHASWKFQNKF